MELGGFGVDRGMKKAMWEEATRQIANMMVQTPYKGFEGEFFGMPERNVIPKPVQKPHPPMWVAASRRETTMVAARLGIGSLGFGFETPEELGDRANQYYELMRDECMPIGHAINPALAVLTSFMCAPTDEEAVHRSRNGPGFFSYSLGYYYNPMTGARHQPGRMNIYKQFMSLPQEERDGRETLRQARLLSREEIAEKEPEDEVQRALFRAARSGQAIGAPDTIRKNIQKYEDQNLDVLILVAQSGDRKHDDIMEAIDLFGRKVLPDFKDRHETKQRKWREQQLDGVDFPVNSSV
jgi:alkanesulfonate monooxygenase SsuD/methylene tetrahydromethanopterin reductase-like flavin-dependent oxidoreductase (luciferase family)